MSSQVNQTRKSQTRQTRSCKLQDSSFITIAVSKGINKQIG